MGQRDGSAARRASWLPLLDTLKGYNGEGFYSDLLAGVITAILLVPQGIAFAMLAGLPPQTGLYASVLPMIAYALLGTSRTLSVGPVSVAAIMVAAALGGPELRGHGDYVTNALVLAFEGGLILLLLAALRLGTLVTFISHPVLTGFTTGAAILIVLSQLPHLLGAKPPHSNAGLAALQAVPGYFAQIRVPALAIGLGCVALLLLCNRPLTRILAELRLPPPAVTGIVRLAPLLAVVLATLAVLVFKLQGSVALAGHVPAGLPAPSLAFLRSGAWLELAPSALFIALIGYVESVAIAKVLANRRKQKIDPNRELVALGAANLAAAFSGTMPVAGGFSRTMVNFTTGARTQVAALISAGLVALAITFLAPLFENIPKAALAAIIIVSIVPLIGLKALRDTWHYDRGDALVMAATLAGVLGLGIEEGLTAGIGLSLLRYVSQAARPHVEVVGRVAHTEQFRSAERGGVETWAPLLLVRVDQNLSFANAAAVEDFIFNALAQHPSAEHVVLIASAVNAIDSSALDTLDALIAALRASGVTFHLADIKAPVLERLSNSGFLQRLRPGEVFASANDAVKRLAGAALWRTEIVF